MVGGWVSAAADSMVSTGARNRGVLRCRAGGVLVLTRVAARDVEEAAKDGR